MDHFGIKKKKVINRRDSYGRTLGVTDLDLIKY